jgi:hypothetical protein
MQVMLGSNGQATGTGGLAYSGGILMPAKLTRVVTTDHVAYLYGASEEVLKNSLGSRPSEISRNCMVWEETFGEVLPIARGIPSLPNNGSPPIV